MSLDIIARGMASSAKKQSDFAVNIVSKFPTGFSYKGSCLWDNLPSEPSIGDAWTITDRNNSEYAWDGSNWIQIDINMVDQTYNSASEYAQSGKAVNQAVSVKEDLSNKVTTLSSGSTDTEYPSAKCMYDIVGDVESILDSLIGGNQ